MKISENRVGNNESGDRRWSPWTSFSIMSTSLAKLLNQKGWDLYLTYGKNSFKIAKYEVSYHCCVFPRLDEVVLA